MNRRVLVRAGLGIPLSLGVLIPLSGCDKQQSMVCADPDKLNTAEASLRKSMNYLERSPESERTCSGCAFYTGTADASGNAGVCGSCRLFDGGPVNAGGHCDSWSAA